MEKTISILGLGWLGLPLANYLTEKGYRVKGSVTSAEKVNTIGNNKIEVSVVNVEASQMEVSDASFFETDVLFINIPPRRIPDIEHVFPNQLLQIISRIKDRGVKKVIFVSSTSVYPENIGRAHEIRNPKPDKASGKACLLAEQHLFRQEDFQTTVIRFGGLIGADRNPHRFMKRGVKNGMGNKPVNLIHLDDCIGIIAHLIEFNVWGEVINGVCPLHPTRAEFYSQAAKAVNVEIPEFESSNQSDFKEVSAQKITEQLGYKFKYPSPLDYLINY